MSAKKKSDNVSKPNKPGKYDITVALDCTFADANKKPVTHTVN